MEKTCVCCKRKFKANPRLKKQYYCNSKGCQKARRNKWYREKKARDPDYRDNQNRCRKQWQQANPDYYRDYRASHPEYVKRNKILQIRRDARKSKNGPVFLAKIDSLIKELYPRKKQLYKLVPESGNFLANIDSLIVNLIPYNMLEKHG